MGGFSEALLRFAERGGGWMDGGVGGGACFGVEVSVGEYSTTS